MRICSVLLSEVPPVFKQSHHTRFEYEQDASNVDDYTRIIARLYGYCDAFAIKTELLQFQKTVALITTNADL